MEIVGSHIHRHHPLRVWGPVGSSIALMAVAAIYGDALALVLTSIGAAVMAFTVVLHVRAAVDAAERIAYLQAALPRLTTAVDAEGVLNLAPKPSVVMGEVLRHHQPGAALVDDVATILPPIDRT